MLVCPGKCGVVGDGGEVALNWLEKSESSQRSSWTISNVILQPRKKTVIKDSQTVQNLSSDAQFRHLRSDLQIDVISKCTQIQCRSRCSLGCSQKWRHVSQAVLVFRVHKWPDALTASPVLTAKICPGIQDRTYAKAAVFMLRLNRRTGGRRSLLWRHPPGHSCPWLTLHGLATVGSYSPAHWNKPKEKLYTFECAFLGIRQALELWTWLSCLEKHRLFHCLLGQGRCSRQRAWLVLRFSLSHGAAQWTMPKSWSKLQICRTINK